VTDTILTTIMCAAKSVYSWDIVVTRVGDKLFFDKREGSTIDLLTVNETAPEQVSSVVYAERGVRWGRFKGGVCVGGGGRCGKGEGRTIDLLTVHDTAPEQVSRAVHGGGGWKGTMQACATWRRGCKTTGTEHHE
jgi:hypothetical protein